MTADSGTMATLTADTVSAMADMLRALDEDMAAEVPCINAGLAGSAVAYRIHPVNGDPDVLRTCLRALRRNPTTRFLPTYLLATRAGELQPETPTELWDIRQQGRLEAGTFQDCVRSMLKAEPS